MDVLAPDVVVLADGGGIAQAVPNAVRGAEKVCRLFLGGMRTAGGGITALPTVVNGHPALAIMRDGELDGIFSARIQEGRIAGIHYMRNPEKLSHLAEAIPLTRR